MCALLCGLKSLETEIIESSPGGVERGCVRKAHYFTNGFEINDHAEGLIFYLYTNKAFKSTRKNTTRTVFKRFISEINEHNQHGT